MHKTKFFSPFCINIKNKTCIYKFSKYFSPFLSIHQQRGENKSNNKDIYAIYIHEERDVKLAPHTYMQWRRDDKTLTHIKHNIQCISGDVKPPTHVYHIRKRGQALLYV